MMRLIVLAGVLLTMLSGCNVRLPGSVADDAADVVAPLARRPSQADELPPPRLSPVLLGLTDDIRVVSSAADNVASRVQIEEADPQQQQIREALHEMLTASSCDVLVERLDRGTFPSEGEIVALLEDKSWKFGLVLAGVPTIAADVLDELRSAVTQTFPDDLEAEKAACERLLLFS